MAVTVISKIIVLICFFNSKITSGRQNQRFEIGADDYYIVKPFEVEELIVRINNILKRSQKKEEKDVLQKTVVIGSYIFDNENYLLKHKIITHRITEKEAQLIIFLHTNRNRLIKREEILREIWGNEDFFSGRSMDVFISRLRKYFKEDSNITISSVRGLGFEFTINN